jgi:hypothetical protein
MIKEKQAKKKRKNHFDGKEVKRWTDEFIRKYRESLEALSKR